MTSVSLTTRVAAGVAALCTAFAAPSAATATDSSDPSWIADPPAAFDRHGDEAKVVGDRTEAAVQCYGNGHSGARVHVLYVHPQDAPSRLSAVRGDLESIAARVDEIFSLSAAETGGDRHVRYVTDGCTLRIDRLAVSQRALASLGTLEEELVAAGYDRDDRKYLVFVDTDSTTHCGVGTHWNDPEPGASNLSNTTVGYSRVDRHCWSGHVAAHELTHNLGAVLDAAPNASGEGHCTDEYDLMCYVDASGRPMRTVCGNPSREDLLDCGHDDYFHTSPPAGSYLATHWNVANSVFLAHAPTLRAATIASACPPSVAPEQPFNDLAADDHHAPSVDCVAGWRIADGTGDGRFDPGAVVTRAQMASFLSRLVEAVQGSPLPEGPDRFSDDGTSVHQSAINALAGAGLVSGVRTGEFAPAQPLTRAQMASLLVRVIEHLGSESVSRRSNFFIDDETDIHQPSINAMAAIGVTGGIEELLYGPGRPIVRNQMATFLARSLAHLVDRGIADVPGTTPDTPNDDVADAAPIDGAQGTVTASTAEATAEAGEPAHGAGGPARSIWYRFTPSADGVLTVDTRGSDFDTVLAAYTGTPFSSLVQQAQNDDTGDRTSEITLTVAAGDVVLIAVDGYNEDAGEVQLSWRFAADDGDTANDDVADARILSGGGGSVSSANTDATIEDGEPPHAGLGPHASVWFSWTPASSGEITFDTLGSTFDTVLAAYTGTPFGGLTSVAGSDDADPPELHSRITFEATAGTRYLVVVDGFGGATGEITLTWH